jgi:peptide/nickel transport system substrate-binding protein
MQPFRTPSDCPTRPGKLSRRELLRLAGLSGGLLALTACQSAPPSSAGPTPTAVAVRNSPSLNTPQASAVPSAAVQAPVAPAVVPAEARGRFAEAWSTTISPAWLDPQENPPQATQWNFQYALHDALVKHLPGKPFAPSLAESYEIAPDFKSATFTLRQGIKFHDGSPITPDDVKFTYEQYRGAGSTVLKAKTERIDFPNDRTVKFVFKEPFLDFLLLYGSPATGAGWILPKAYYEKVGKDGFKNAPIGAGPYRFLRQQAGVELEMEAFGEYWRKRPAVKTLLFRGIPEASTRMALLKTGEIDAAFQIQGELLKVLQADSSLRMTATRSGAVWLELMALDSPDHPLKDLRVRQAVSLVIDRQALNDAELNGLSPIEGNWIPQDWPGAIQRPTPPTDVERAKKLLAEAGVGDGFDVSAITPLPPYFSWAERLATQMRTVGIRTTVQTMERGAFFEKLANGPNRITGFVMQFSGAPGDAATRIREDALCQGAFSGLCLPDIDDRMKAYDASTDLAQRKQLIEEVQTILLDQYMMVPVMRQVNIWGFGPRFNAPLETISGAVPQYAYLGPYEDFLVKEG